MDKIKHRNIPLFIGKILLMILLDIIAGFIIFAMNLGYIILIIFPICLVFNLYTLVILYTKKTVYILKCFDLISLIILIITFIVLYIWALSFVGEEEMGSWGGLIFTPLYLNIFYFLIAFIIDIIIMKKINKIE